MLPILPLLLILLFPGMAGARVEASPVSGAAYERRLVAALVQTVRQEAEREALAASTTPPVVVAKIALGGVREPEFVVRASDRVRDGPRG